MYKTIKNTICLFILMICCFICFLSGVSLSVKADETYLPLHLEISSMYEKDDVTIKFNGNSDFLNSIGALNDIRKYISINGYKIADENKINLNYNSENKQLIIVIDNDWYGKIEKDKLNTIVVSKEINLLGVIIESNMVFQNIVGSNFWNELEVEGVTSFENQQNLFNGSYSKAIVDYGWAYGFSTVFNTPLLVTDKNINYEENVEDKFIPFIDINGNELNKDKVEMFYNYKTFTLDVFIDKSENLISTYKPCKVIFKRGFPIVGGELKNSYAVYYYPQASNVIVEDNPIIDYYDSFDLYDKSYWVKKEGFSLIEDGYLKTNDFYGVRWEKSGDFDLVSNFRLINENSKVIFTFRASDSLKRNNGYCVEISNKQIVFKKMPRDLLVKKDITINLGVNYEFKLYASDDLFKVYINDELIFKLNNNLITFGNFGLGAENDVWFDDFSITSHFKKSEDVAQNIESVPEILKNQIEIVYPNVPEGFTIKLFKSSDEYVIDTNGRIYLQTDTEKIVSLVFIITSGYDDSKAYTNEIEVKVPVSDINENNIQSIENKQVIINTLSRLNIVESNLSEGINLLQNELLKLNRWQVKPEDRNKFDSYFNMINSLIGKAEKIVKGECYNDKLGSLPQKSDAVALSNQAKKFILDYLRMNTFLPVSFMGEGGHVVDFSIFYDVNEQLYHIYYIYGYAGYTWQEIGENTFRHATSPDLKNWTFHGEALRDSVNGRDNYKVWAPTVTEINGKYYMFYTAVNQNVAQCVQIAVSDDLYVWNKIEGVSIIPGIEWSGWSEEKWSDGRDPGVLVDGDKVYVYTASCTKEGMYCISVSSSNINNLIDWTDEGYINLGPGTYESPYVQKIGDKYHLFYTNYGVTGDPSSYIKHAVSYSPTGGFENVNGDGKILQHKSASEIIYNSDTDNWYIAYLTHFGFSIHCVDIEYLFWNEDDDSLNITPMSLKENNILDYSYKGDIHSIEINTNMDFVGDNLNNIERYIQHYVEINGKKLSELSLDNNNFFAAHWISKQGKAVLKIEYSDGFKDCYCSGLNVEYSLLNGLKLPNGDIAEEISIKENNTKLIVIIVISIVLVVTFAVVIVLIIKKKKTIEV